MLKQGSKNAHVISSCSKNANGFLLTIKKARKIRHFLAYPIKFESHHRHHFEGKTSNFWQFSLFFLYFLYSFRVLILVGIYTNE